MNRIHTRFAALVLTVFTLLLALSREMPPVLPEPGAQRIVVRAFGAAV